MQDAGVATFLFTDIEGSTRLWEEQPERMRPALACHDALARESVEAHGGRIVKTTGDGLHAVFDDPLDAVHATIQLQYALEDPARTSGMALKVRCGLHAGPFEWRDHDCYGAAVNRAARVMGAAHGGQVLVSQAVADAVASRLAPPVSLLDLGRVRLRDLASAERLHQVLAPGLRRDFPALRSLQDTPNNLPQQASTFVGRQRELQQAAGLLGSHRLVTLLGLGGVGKTRLSLHAAAERLEAHRDGVWLVELGAVQEAFRVAEAIAAVLGVKEEPGGTVESALARFVQDRELLLVLDNCEHVLAGAAAAARLLLSHGAAVRILATSREPLRIPGEATCIVAGLPVPTPRAALAPDGAGHYDAVRLFVDRAQAAQPSFRLTADNATLVAAICNRLDGIPLAVELAAARVRTLPLAEVAARLKDRFRLLANGDPTALPRQRTLRALLDWSYDLLSEPERAIFRRLAVFAGGWTLEAAEDVCAGGGIEAADVFDVLGSLAEKSLVAVDEDAQRYRMLETVRAYALQRVAQSGEVDATHDRHLAHFAAFGAKVRRQLAGPGQAAWLTRVDAERENILAALEWARRTPRLAAEGLRLANAFKLYWMNRGLLHLGLQVTLDAIQRSGPEPTPDLAQGLFNAGQIRYFMGAHREAREVLEQSLAIARRLGDAYVAAVLQPLGMAALAEGQLERARACFEEAVALTRVRADAGPLAGALNALATLHCVDGQPARARPLYEEVVRLSRESGNDEVEATGRLNLAMVAIEARRMREAFGMLGEALRIAANIRSARAAQGVLDGCAALAACAGDAIAAAWFFGAAQAQAERSGAHREIADARFLEPRIALVRQALGGAAFAEAEGAGRRCETFAALDEAGAWLAKNAPAAAPVAETLTASR